MQSARLRDPKSDTWFAIRELVKWFKNKESTSVRQLTSTRQADVFAYGAQIADITTIGPQRTRIRLMRSPVVSATIVRRYNDILATFGSTSKVQFLRGKLLIDGSPFGEVATIYPNGKSESEEERNDCV